MHCPARRALPWFLVLAPALAQDPPPPTETDPPVDTTAEDAPVTQDEAPLSLEPAEPRPTVVVDVQRPTFDVRRLDGMGPVGLAPVADVLPAGTFGVRMRTRHERTDGARDGSSKVSSAQLFGAGYTVAPTDGERDTLELDLLYGLDAGLTLQATLPYVRTSLDQDLSGGGTANATGSGFGDLTLGANLLVHEVDGERIGVHLGFALPTGTYDETGNWAGVAGTLLPYWLQPADGTFDALAAVDWRMLMGGWSWGFQARGRWPLGENGDDWGYSRSGELNAWAATPLARSLSTSLRLSYASWGDVHGAATALTPTRSPLEDAGRQGGERLSVHGGLAWDLSPQEGAGSNRLELEIGVPVHEWLDGPGPRQTLVASFGWRLLL